MWIKIFKIPNGIQQRSMCKACHQRIGYNPGIGINLGMGYLNFHWSCFEKFRAALLDIKNPKQENTKYCKLHW